MAADDDNMDVARFVRALEDDDDSARAAAFGHVYDRMREVARGYMHKERDGHTLEPTELVNEACLRLIPDIDLDEATRGRLVGFAARAMRQVLVDHARKNAALKRGGEFRRVTLRGIAADDSERGVRLDSLAAALDWLETQDPVLAEMTEWHYFGGMTGNEIAARREVSRATVNRELSLARALLLSRIDAIEAERPEA